MSLVFNSAKKFRWYVESTGSPGLFHGTGAEGGCVWIKIPDSFPAAEQCIFHSDNDGADSSFEKLSLTTLHRLRWQCSDSTAANTDDDTDGLTLTAGWHLIMWGNSGGSKYFRLDGDSTLLFTSTAAAQPDTLLTRTSYGRSLTTDATDYLDAEMYQLSVASDPISASEFLAMYNSGVPVADPATTLNGTIGWIPLSANMTAGGTTEAAIAPITGITPTFVDDEALTGNSWTAPAIQTIPATRNLSILSKGLSHDFVIFSDSFGGYWGGVQLARYPVYLWDKLAAAGGTRCYKTLKGWDEYAHTTANVAESTQLAAGTTSSADSTTLIVATPTGNGFNHDDGLGGTDWMSLPIAQRQMSFGATPTGSEILQMEISNMNVSALTGGPSDNWLNSSDTIGCTPLFYKHPNNQLDSYVPVNNTTDGTEVSGLSGGSYSDGVINALPEFDLTIDSGTNERRFAMKPPSGVMSNAANLFHTSAGAILRNKTQPTGVGMAVIADASYQVDGHKDNISATSLNQKDYSDAELEPVLSAFHEAGRKMIFVMGIAQEGSTQKADTAAWITKMKARCTSAGITNYGFLLISWAPRGGSDQADARSDADGIAVDYDDLANSDPLVAHVSVHKLINGAQLHDSSSYVLNEANDAPWQALKDFDTANGTDLESDTSRVWLAVDANHASGDGGHGEAIVISTALQAGASGGVPLIVQQMSYGMSA